MKTKFLTFALTSAIITHVLPSLQAQFLTIGIDAGLTQSLDSNGNADAAFNAWAAGLGIGTPDITAWTSNAHRDAGLIPGTGGNLVMDTGSAANSPFGSQPPASPSSGPVTRSYTGGPFSYTVTSVLYANNDPATWANNPGLGTNILGLIAGTGPTIQSRHVPMIVENPASQGSLGGVNVNVSPDGRNIFGYDGGTNVNVNLGGGVTNSNQRKSGFVLSFSNPISAFGFYAADFESVSTPNSNNVATAFLFNSDGNLIDFQQITVDGNDREGFYGIKRSTADISHAMFIVGARDGVDTPTNARQNSYAFGGFTFIAAEIPEPRVYIAMAILALCVAYRESRRLHALMQKKVQHVKTA